MAKRKSSTEICFQPPVKGETWSFTGVEEFAARVENFDILPDRLVTRLEALTVFYEGEDITGFIPTGSGGWVCDTGVLKHVSEDGSVFEGPFVGEGSSLDYALYNDSLYFATTTGLWEIANQTIRKAALPEVSPLPAFNSNPAGSSKIAVAYVDADGREGPATIIGGGTVGDVITIPALPSGMRMRLYTTSAESSEFRMFFEGEEGDSASVPSVATGATALFLYHTGFPAVDLVTWYGGKLFAASGNILYMSSDFNPAMRDIRYGHFEFTGTIRIAKVLATGVLVGDDRGLWYIDVSREDPSVTYIASYVVPKYSAVRVNMADFSNVQQVHGVGVIVLTSVGHVLIAPDLTVTRLTAGEVKLNLPLEARSFYVDNNGCRRVVTTFESALDFIVTGG